MKTIEEKSKQEAATTNACCSPAEKEVCCEPEAKETCCRAVDEEDAPAVRATCGCR